LAIPLPYPTFSRCFQHTCGSPTYYIMTYELFAKLTTGSVSTARMGIYIVLSRTVIMASARAIESRPAESIFWPARAHLEGGGKRGSRTKDKAAYHGRGKATISAACCRRSARDDQFILTIGCFRADAPDVSPSCVRIFHRLALVAHPLRSVRWCQTDSKIPSTVTDSRRSGDSERYMLVFFFHTRD
jgi:hypothetical protein